MNEVIKRVLNFLLFFYEKILHAPKSTKKHQKAPKSIKSTKNITKQKNKYANKRTKIKNTLKKHLRGKSPIFAYLHICAFEVKKIEESLQWKCWSH